VLDNDEQELSSKIVIKEEAKEMKQAQVSEVKKQTNEYRQQLVIRQEEFQKSQKEQGRGACPPFS